MAENKKEEVVEQTTEQAIQEPKVEEKKSEDKITVKKKPSMKKFNTVEENNGVIKVDLNKPKEKVDTVEEKVENKEVAKEESVIKEINCFLLFLSQLCPSFDIFIVFGL